MQQALQHEDRELIKMSLYNSLEPVTIRKYPELKEIKSRLSQYCTLGVLMSGSGPTIFGLMPKTEDLQDEFKDIKLNICSFI